VKITAAGKPGQGASPAVIHVGSRSVLIHEMGSSETKLKKSFPHILLFQDGFFQLKLVYGPYSIKDKKSSMPL
jgi:hypothetical protein